MDCTKNSTIPVFNPLQQTILEGLFPGYSILTRFVSLYFHIDATSYLLVFAIFLAFWAYAVPAFWGQLQFLFIFSAASVEIRYHDDLYDDAIHWISSHVTLSKARQLVAGTKPSFLAPRANEEEDDIDLSKEGQMHFEDDKRDFWTKRKYLDKIHAIRFTPAPGEFHYFIYDGCWICLRRQPYKDLHSPWANMEKLLFYAAPWRQGTLKELLLEIQETSAKRDLGRINIYRGLKSTGTSFDWLRVASKSLRSLSTVVLHPEQKASVIDDIRDYLHPRTRDFYESRGVPYRRGYLLYGLPGTGKSSFCLSIASLTRLNIYMLGFNANGLDDNSLELLFQSLPRRCIVLLEDVDEAGILQRRATVSSQSSEDRDEGMRLVENSDATERQPKAVTLSAFLNVIDGVAAQEGRILFMTTNHIERLDPALLRPGRVDMQIAFGPVDRFSAQEHFLIFYLKPLNAFSIGTRDYATGAVRPVLTATTASAELDVNYITALGMDFATKIPLGKYVAAELQNYLVQHRNNPKSAVDGVEEWVNQTSGQVLGNVGKERTEKPVRQHIKVLCCACGVDRCDTMTCPVCGHDLCAECSKIY